MKCEQKPVMFFLLSICVLALASAASAQDKSANMPAANPYLHDSH